MSEPTVATAATWPPPAKVLSEWEYTSPLIGCRFDPTGKRVVTAAQDSLLQRWDLESGKRTIWTGHESWVRAIGFSPDGSQAISGGYEGRLCWWNVADDAEQLQPLRQVEAHQGWIRALSVSPDGRWLVTGGNDARVCVWNAQDGSLVQTFTGHKAHVYSVLFPDQNDIILSGDLLGVVHQWDITSGKLMRTLDAAELHSPNEGQGARYGGVRSMARSRDGKLLACGGLHKATNPFGAVQEPLVLFFDWETGTKAAPRLADGITQGIIWRVVFHAQGDLCAVSGGANGGFLLCWHPQEEKQYHKFQLPNTALDMDLHADGLRFVTVHHDRRVRVSGPA